MSARPWPNSLGWDYRGAEVRILRAEGADIWRVFAPIGDTGTHRRLDVPPGDPATIPELVRRTRTEGALHRDA